jgi:hypothetical protein
MGNLCCAREHSVQFFVQFFLDSETAQFYLERVGPLMLATKVKSVPVTVTLMLTTSKTFLHINVATVMIVNDTEHYPADTSIETNLMHAAGGCVLAFSTQLCGFKPGRSRRIFQGEKILSKAVGPMS